MRKRTACLLLAAILAVSAFAPVFSEDGLSGEPAASPVTAEETPPAEEKEPEPEKTPEPEKKSGAEERQTPERTPAPAEQEPERKPDEPEASGASGEAEEQKPEPAEPEKAGEQDAGGTDVPEEQENADGAGPAGAEEEEAEQRTEQEEDAPDAEEAGTDSRPEDAPEGKGTEENPEAEEAAAGDPADAERAETEDPEPEPPSQLSKAVNLKLSSDGLTSMLLTFDGDPEPTLYRVYRATEKTGKYTYLGYAWETEPGSGKYRYEDLTAKKGTVYYYKARALILTPEGKQWGDGYSAIVSGKTKPGSVGKVTGAGTAASAIRITWNTVKGATGYTVSRSTNLYSGYTLLYTAASGSAAAYTDKTVKTGMQYYYRVRAFYDPGNGAARILGPFSYSSVILCEPVPPKNFKVSKNTDTTVTLSWTPAAGVEYYNIKYSWKEDGSTRSETVTGIAQSRSTYQVKELRPGQALSFQIWSIAFTNKGDQMRSGVAECAFTIPGEDEGTGKNGPEQDPGASGAEEPEDGQSGEEEPLYPDEDEGTPVEKESAEGAPEITGYDVTSAGVQLTWQAVPGAAGYRVERSEKQNSGYKTIAQGITEEGFLDTTTATGGGYYYRVSVAAEDGTELTGGPKGVFASTALSLTAKKGADGYYTFTWSSRKNAAEYRIYRSADGGAFQRVATVNAASARSWTDTAVAAGSAYVYYVRAWTAADGKKIGGAKGKEKSLYIGVRENPAITVTQEASKISVTWEKVENASGYAVYGAKGDEKLELLERVSASTTSWKQTPPAASGYLKYYVRAYAVVGGKKKYAPASDPVVVRRLAPPQVSVARGPEQNTLSVRWSEVTGAGSYRVYYRLNPDGEYLYIETDGRSAVIPAEGGKTASVYVRAQTLEGEELFLGSRSAVKSFTPYWKYALLIGNNRYTTKSNLGRLAATAADVAGLSVVLDRQNGWQVNACANMTGSEILSAISRFFADADENCTCLFYYSGHGLKGEDERTGSLCGIDGSYVTLAELKAALGRVPGKSVVLMDSCGSGAAVENSTGAATLGEDKYSVVTAAAAYESSYANVFHSYFTYYLAFGSGYDYDTKRALSSLPADADRDGVISFREICDYIVRYMVYTSGNPISTVTEKLPEPGAPLY